MKNIYEMNEKDIYEFIENQMPIKKLEKDKYGEVFTSPVLINKMLDLFPSSVWTNHKLSTFANVKTMHSRNHSNNSRV